MNLGQLRARCQTRFRDISSLIVTVPTWNDHLNATYRAFLRAARWPFLMTSVDAIVAANARLVPLDPNVIANLENVYDESHDRMLEPMPTDKMRWRFALFLEQQEAGEPSFYKVLGPNLYLVPTPATGVTLKVFHYTEPVTLDSDDDVPEIPERYQEGLVVGAIAKAQRDDQNAEYADQYDREFSGIVQQAKEELILGEVSSVRGFLSIPSGAGGAGSDGAGSGSPVGSEPSLGAATMSQRPGV